MSHNRLRWLSIFVLLAATAAGAFFFVQHSRYKTMHTIPPGFTRFDVSAPPPAYGRWKDHMPTTRDPDIYRPYIEARKIWRSKIGWKLTHEEALRILTDVTLASQKGDWGARALLASFYREGLGVLPSNHVLDPDPVKAMELTRSGVEAGQPWAFYDMGVAYEHGDGGVPYDVDIAWAYYLRAAELGSPEAQMTLADAYGNAKRFDAQEMMEQYAYKQNHGAAALALGVDRRASKKDFKEAIKYFQDGVKFGNKDCADALSQLFEDGFWITSDMDAKAALRDLGITVDPERAHRYDAIGNALQINPDLKLTRLDQVLPLPPATLPSWNGIEDAVEPPSTAPPTY
jgi:TPR repeat protein